MGEPRDLEDLPEPTPGATGPKALIVNCTGCGADISKTCLAGHVPGPAGQQLVVLVPVRCPECGHPAIQMGGLFVPGRG